MACEKYQQGCRCQKRYDPCHFHPADTPSMTKEGNHNGSQPDGPPGHQVEKQRPTQDASRGDSEHPDQNANRKKPESWHAAAGARDPIGHSS